MYNLFIADDHTVLRNGLKRIIEENAGYKIIGETGNGLEIVRQLRKLRPDMIILDISLPGLRGIEAVNKIRKFNKNIKILILTMHKNDEYVYECLVNGAQGYLLKEDADTELIAAIKEIQKNKIYISSSFSSEVISKLVQHRSKERDKRRRSVFKDLSPREREVLKLIAEGNQNKKVARKLGISVRTVEHHRLSIMRKLNVSNTAGLVKYAIKAGLIYLT
ncbi:MAG: response regulator transcription factor [bacterium]